MLDVEFPLIKGQFVEIDEIITKAEKELNCSSNFEGVKKYIDETRDKLNDLEMRVQKSKDNVEEIQKVSEQQSVSGSIWL